MSSTSELTLKTSVLPIVVNGKTSLHTLTQSFYVTKVVEAVKTVPAGENYEFIATQAFKDFSNVLEEAGSEKREQLLPGMKSPTLFTLFQPFWYCFNRLFHGFWILIYRDDYIWVFLTSFVLSFKFWGSWGGSKNLLKLKIEPP